MVKLNGLQHHMSEDLPYLDCPTYKWIFVTGKGGVGKTSTSCAIAVTLSRRRNKVLLVSTDPASNICDVFQQHFTSKPALVNGFTNLYASEAPSQSNMQDDSQMKTIFQMPGIDEVQVLSSLFGSIETEDYDIVIFDTAPTGHTMRLLTLPQNAQVIFGAFEGLGGSLMSMFSTMQNEETASKVERIQQLLTRVSSRLKNPLECTCVCVLIPEYAPLLETERLIEFFTDKEIESHTLVVNQIISDENVNCCPLCARKYEKQQSYLEHINDVYDDFRICNVNQLDDEIKGLEMLEKVVTQVQTLFTK